MWACLSHSTSDSVLMYYVSIAACVMLHTMYMMLHVCSGNDGIASALLYMCCFMDIAVYVILHAFLMYVLLHLCIA